MKPRALALVGPTASGKTGLAIALARRFDGEVISIDSAQVYRGMDVGTAKPSAAERKQVPHHLVDIVDPTGSFSAGRFRDAALRLVPEIHARGKLPILVGGTMLYFRALTKGLADLPTADAQLRAGIEERAAQHGWPALHAELGRVDPETAARLEPTDAQRIQRALEVHAITGVPLSSLHRTTTSSALPFETLRIAIEPSERSVLHQRIADRFRAMLRGGLVEEVRALRERWPLRADLPSMRCVGYRQAWDTIEGAAPAATLEARGVAATRQLAKRQITWLRAMDDVERFDCLRGDLVDAVAARVASFVAR